MSAVQGSSPHGLPASYHSSVVCFLLYPSCSLVLLPTLVLCPWSLSENQKRPFKEMGSCCPGPLWFRDLMDSSFWDQDLGDVELGAVLGGYQPMASKPLSHSSASGVCPSSVLPGQGPIPWLASLQCLSPWGIPCLGIALLRQSLLGTPLPPSSSAAGWTWTLHPLIRTSPS